VNQNVAGSDASLIGLVFVTNAQVVTGTTPSVAAAPFLSGGNGTHFGNPLTGLNDQPNGVDATRYIAAGGQNTNPGAQVTLNLPAEEMYFGLLWGSVDTFNTLTFFDGATQVGVLTGASVDATATGNQGLNGTFYVNINSTLQFNRVVAQSTINTFEFDNVAINPQRINDVVPEASSLAVWSLLGIFGAAAMVISQKRSSSLA
jgi:hypothetical protein